MNTQLANSLAEAVSALSLEDFQAFQTALLSHMVKKTPGVAGGYACIRNTRIAVWTLISLSQHLSRVLVKENCSTTSPA
jgi:hypothetical protein